MLVRRCAFDGGGSRGGGGGGSARGEPSARSGCVELLCSPVLKRNEYSQDSRFGIGGAEPRALVGAAQAYADLEELSHVYFSGGLYHSST